METKQEAVKENGQRIKSLQNAASKTNDSKKRRSYIDLADRMLFAADNGLLLPSLADKRYCRYIRRKEHRLIFKALSRYSRSEIRCVHTVLGRSVIPQEDLADFDFGKFNERYRYHLRVCGSGRHKGVIISRIHGEHEPNQGTYLPHTHAFVAGDKLALLPVLKRYYNRIDSLDGPKRKVLVQELNDTEHQGDYPSQAFWPSRYVGPAANDPNKTVRQRTKARIPEPWHADWLVKMDRTNPTDLILVVGDSELSLAIRSMYRYSYRKHSLSIYNAYSLQHI